MLCWNCFREKDTEKVCPHCGYEGGEQQDRYPLALRPGTILNGRYIVGRVLGQGGFGITYLAWDDRMGDRVAIKEYYPVEFAGRTFDGVTVAIHSADRQEDFNYGKEQFLAEARTLAAVTGSDNILRIYSYFEENDTAYFSMEYIEGRSLDAYLKELGRPMTVQRAEDLFLPLMTALETVHKKGIIHRDIAPDNIIVTPEGKAKLIDFGAARYSTGEKSKSLDVILKHGFAPMEQYTRRGRQGPWTDVYALAATFYYTITGKVPPDAIERIAEDDLASPSSMGVIITEEKESALLHALAVQANDRLQNMEDFCAALEGKPFSSQEDNQQEGKKDTANRERNSNKKKSSHKKKWLALICGIGITAVLILIGLKVLEIRKSNEYSGEESIGVSPTEEALYRAEAEPVIRVLAAGDAHTVHLLQDGTVLSTGSNKSGQCSKTENWGNIVSVVASGNRTVGLKNDGTVLLAGAQYNDVLAVESWAGIVDIASGSEHTVGLRENGTVVATGNNDAGQCNVEEWNNIRSISAGGFHTVGLKENGTALAVGWNNSGQRSVSEWTDLISVAAGYEHTVGLKKNGSVVAVGRNTDRQCEVNGWTDIIAVAAGKAHTVGLRADGTVVATGNNNDGQCNVDDWTGVIAITAGAFHTVGLREDGTILATGKNLAGQCDVNELYIKDDHRQNAYERRLALSKTLDAGGGHTVGLRADGTVVAVGDNASNQCEVSEWAEIVSVIASDDFTLGLKEDGTVVATNRWLWGTNYVDTWKDIIAIDAGKTHSIGLKSDGTVVADGSDDERQCDVEEWRNIVAVAAGSFHSVGLREDGTVVATGKNDFGQCDVEAWTDIIAVSAGYDHTIGLRSDGTVLATGSDEERQCRVDNWTGIVSIDAGSGFSLGLTKDGAVYATGRNDSHQCSFNGSSGTVALAAGNMHAVRVKSDGTVEAKGENVFGQCNVSEWKDIRIPEPEKKQ